MVTKDHSEVDRSGEPLTEEEMAFIRWLDKKVDEFVLEVREDEDMVVLKYILTPPDWKSVESSES